MYKFDRCRRQKRLPGQKHWECIFPRKETLQSRKGSVIFLGKLHWRQENYTATTAANKTAGKKTLPMFVASEERELCVYVRVCVFR